MRQYILTRKIDKAPNSDIAAELTQLFGVTYNENYINNIAYKEIPERIAFIAKKHRVCVETPRD